MRASLLLLLLPLVVGVSEKFSAEVEGLQCTFGMVYKGSKVDLRKSKVTCSKPKKTVRFTGEVASDSGTVFSITLMVTKKGAKLLKASVSTGSTPGGPTVGGSGSGRPPVGGSGSGRPPTGGSGSGRPPTGGSGSGSGGPSTGGIWDDMCFCVDEDVCNLPMPGGMGGGPQGSGRPPVGGSGSGRPPPGGSGSGRPPPGGSGSGRPPPGGSGSGGSG